MSTTTGPDVATVIAARITAITPAYDSSDRFEEITYEQGLRPFALANPAGCLRRFSVMPGPDVELPDITDGLVEAVWQGFLVEVAYPTDWRCGPQGIRDLVKRIQLDREQISKTVGTNGYATYASEPGSITATTTLETRDDMGPVQIAVVGLRARYFRSATP